MEQRTEEFNQVRGKMASDIKAVVSDGHDLLKAAANVSSAGIAVVREKFDEKLNSAKDMLMDTSRPAVDKVRRTAVATNKYVHGNPWPVIGFAVVASVLIGFLAAKR